MGLRRYQRKKWEIPFAQILPWRTIFNEATAIPFTEFFTLPVHPGVQVGTEFNYNKATPSRLFQTANLSYFFHNRLNQGVALNTELGYEYRFKFGLSLSARLGVGYMHTFAVTEEYAFEDGVYEKKQDRGNSRLYPSLSLGIGYYLFENRTNSPQIFINYQSWAEYPYSPGFIPIMTHINLHIGAKFFISQKQNH